MKFIKRVMLLLASLLLVSGIPITANIDVHAESLGKIEIIKQDKADGTRLEGAEFAIYDSRNLMVEYLVTDATGKAITEELPIGEYRIQEVAAPTGYKHEPTAIPISIAANGQIATIIIWNTKLPEIPETAKLEIIKVDSVTGERLAGAEFVITDSKGNIVDRVITDANGSGLSKDLILGMGMYRFYEEVAPPGYSHNPKPNGVYLTVKDQIFQKIITNNKIPDMGKIQIMKQDKADGTKLAGAEFEVRDENGMFAARLVTDANGQAITGNLLLGNYTLVETKAPAGYDLNPTPILVTVTTNGQIVMQTIDNTKTPIVPDTGTIEITKQDKDDGTKLAGAEFDVKDASGAIVSHLITDVNGKATTPNLPLGNYNLVETIAPAGYDLNLTPIPVTIATNGQVVMQTVDNTKTPVIPETGTIEITKQDKDDGTKLAGAEFDVKDASGAIVSHLITDTNGKATTPNLPLGNYNLVETIAPAGYDLNSTPIPITIATNGQVVMQTVDNTKTPLVPETGTIEITKQDKDDGTKLIGAVFEVRDGVGTLVDTLITDTNGKATTPNLPLGNYNLVETIAPTGYDLNSTPIPVTIATNGQIVMQTVDNTKTPIVPETGTIEITKQDKDDGTKLAGAEFDVKDASGAIVSHFITNVNGKATTPNLPLGDYNLVETKAPGGYQLDDTPILVTITTNGQVIQKVITNSEIAGEIVYFSGIEITKEDKVDRTKLAGAEFDIKNIKGDVVDHVVTDTNGIAKTKSLPLGIYTLIETKAPNGYILDATPINIAGDAKDEVYKVTVDNTKTPDILKTGKIEITKQDKGDGVRLAGAEFDVKDANGVTVAHLITDINGKATTGDLPLGNYTLVETKAPKGYKLDNTPILITIATSGQVVKQTVDNVKVVVVPQVGKIEITKQGKGNGVRLVGAEFDVKDANGVIVAHLITDINGKATTGDLPLGNYTLVETKAPSGYELNTTPIPVIIATNGQIVKQTIDNIKSLVFPQGGQDKIDQQDQPKNIQIEQEFLPDTNRQNGGQILLLLISTFIMIVVFTFVKKVRN